MLCPRLSYVIIHIIWHILIRTFRWIENVTTTGLHDKERKHVYFSTNKTVLPPCRVPSQVWSSCQILGGQMTSLMTMTMTMTFLPLSLTQLTERVNRTYPVPKIPYVEQTAVQFDTAPMSTALLCILACQGHGGGGGNCVGRKLSNIDHCPLPIANSEDRSKQSNRLVTRKVLLTSVCLVAPPRPHDPPAVPQEPPSLVSCPGNFFF